MKQREEQMLEDGNSKIFYNKQTFRFSLDKEKACTHYFFIDKNLNLSIYNLLENDISDIDTEIAYIKNNSSLKEVSNLRDIFANMHSSLDSKEDKILYYKLTHSLLEVLYSYHIEYDKILILCDLDGTLSEARTKVWPDYICKINSIIQSESSKYSKDIRKSSKDIQIGILTGSNAGFISNQIDTTYIDFNFTLFPVNGTEKIYPNVIGDPFDDLIFESDDLTIQDFIGEQKYYELLNYLLQKQIDVMSLLKSKNIYCTGNFISNRGLTLNMCPMGRNYLCSERRKLFVDNDGLNIRMNIIDEINEKFSDANIIAVLGGDTSIDIYPKECGKEFVLMRRMSLTSSVYFIGDRIHKNGNDHSIYKILEKTSMSSGTKNPNDTLFKIKNALNILL